MSDQKPTIVFVTGAWHKPPLYASFLTGLKNAGYKVHAPAHPSIGGHIPDFNEDVSGVRTAIESAISQDEEVIVIMHSYGGVVGSAASKGLSASETNKGGVIKLIYIASFALDEGVSLHDLTGGPAPWYIDLNETQWGAGDTKNVFYNDIDASVAEGLEKQLEPHAKGCMESKQTFAAWKEIESVYVVCDLDNAIPRGAQEGMAAQKGGKWVGMEHLEAGHTPFVSRPEETVAVVRKIIEG